MKTYLKELRELIRQASGEQAGPVEGSKALIWERAWYKQHPGARRTGGETEGNWEEMRQRATRKGQVTGALQAMRITFAFSPGGMGAMGSF